MNVMEAVAVGRPSPRHISVHEEAAEYVIEIDVSDFTCEELEVEATGHRVTVHGDRAASNGKPFVLHERLEESFRLPDDAEGDRVSAFYTHGTLEIHARRKRLAAHRIPVGHDYLVGDVPKGS